MSTTELVLLQNIGNELGRGSGTCSAAGTTTTIVDTSTDSPFDSSDDSASLFKNAWAMIEDDTADPALNEGAVRRIRTYAPGSQTLTLASALANATTTTQSYGIYMVAPPIKLGIHKGIREYINDTLRELYYRAFVLLTLVTDGDMETSGTSNWTASNSTLAKTATAATVQLGTQAMSVTNSAANGYARSALVSVTENQVYSVLADCYATTGTARLQLYDETNSVAIQSKTSDQTEWRTLYFQATIPSGCEQVSVRLVGDESSAVCTWDNVSLRNVYARSMTLPEFTGDSVLIENKEAVEDLQFWWGGTEFESSHAISERRRESAGWSAPVQDLTGLTPWRIDFAPQPPSESLLVAKVLRHFKQLSAITDTTMANPDLVEAGVLSKIYADKQNKEKLAIWLPRYRALRRTYQPRITRPLFNVRPD